MLKEIPGWFCSLEPYTKLEDHQVLRLGPRTMSRIPSVFPWWAGEDEAEHAGKTLFNFTENCFPLEPVAS